MSDHGSCPRCAEDKRITMHGARKVVMFSCDRCGEQWGDVSGHANALAQAKAERDDALGPSAPIFLPGVSTWRNE